MCVIPTKLNLVAYLQILEANLPSFAAKHFSGDYFFQQDNAPAHSAGVTKAWFAENSIAVLKWPAKLPDLSPIENLWGLMAREVYENGQRQFNNVEEL